MRDQIGIAWLADLVALELCDVIEACRRCQELAAKIVDQANQCQPLAETLDRIRQAVEHE